MASQGRMHGGASRLILWGGGAAMLGGTLYAAEGIISGLYPTFHQPLLSGALHVLPSPFLSVGIVGLFVYLWRHTGLIGRILGQLGFYPCLTGFILLTFVHASELLADIKVYTYFLRFSDDPGLLLLPWLGSALFGLAFISVGTLPRVAAASLIVASALFLMDLFSPGVFRMPALRFALYVMYGIIGWSGLGISVWLGRDTSLR